MAGDEVMRDGEVCGVMGGDRMMRMMKMIDGDGVAMGDGRKWGHGWSLKRCR